MIRGGPALGPERHGLGKVLNGGRHGGLLQVSKLRLVSMRMMDEEMLKEEDGIEGRDQFHVSAAKSLAFCPADLFKHVAHVEGFQQREVCRFKTVVLTNFFHKRRPWKCPFVRTYG